MTCLDSSPRAICESHHAAVGFQTKVPHFWVKNTPLKDKWKLRESSNECSVTFGVDKGEILATKWSFEEFNDVFFAAERK